jgi:amidase
MTLFYRDALALAQLVRDRVATPLELVEATLEELAAIDERLNIISTPMEEEARAAARTAAVSGVFAGVPLLVKEFAAVAGVRSSAASKLLLDRVSAEDGELVRRYRNAGLIIAGKTNASEFGILGTTEPAAFGATRNPWDLSRTSGGSSGGSAAAVGAGIVPMAQASDGGGSIRIPASCCGVFGLKPTRGRNPLSPTARDAGGLVCEHVITRSVGDSAAALDASAGAYAGDGHLPAPEMTFLEFARREPGRLRIAWGASSPLGFPVHDDCIRAVEDAAVLCQSLGHDVEERSPAFDTPERMWDGFHVIWSSAIASWVDAVADELGPAFDTDQIEPLSRAMRVEGRKHSAMQLQDALEQFRIAAAQAAEFHETYDVWLTPTLAEPPVELGWFDQPLEDPMRAYRRDAEFCAFTPIANATGQPAMSVPLWWNDQELPVGVHFTAAFGNEGTLFSLAGQLERARPWRNRFAPFGVPRERESAKAV